MQNSRPTEETFQNEIRHLLVSSKGKCCSALFFPTKILTKWKNLSVNRSLNAASQIRLHFKWSETKLKWHFMSMFLIFKSNKKVCPLRCSRTQAPKLQTQEFKITETSNPLAMTLKEKHAGTKEAGKQEVGGRGRIHIWLCVTHRKKTK